MILRLYRQDHRMLIGFGQIFLILGIVGMRFVYRWVSSPGIAEFWPGFTAGICSVFLGISIVFNIAGLMQHRASRKNR